jgi:DNA-directed RNA polymerase subunit beta'
MGYIDLTCPVTHLWYLKGVPNYLVILLKCFDEKLTVGNIEQIVYFKEGERMLPSSNPLYSFFYPEKEEKKNLLKKVLNEQSSLKDLEKEKEKIKTIPPKYLKSGRQQKRRGAEIIKAALEEINLKIEIKKARNVVENLSITNLNQVITPDKALIRRIRILESFLATKINPSWMILTTLPVLPPNLRPLLELENGRLVAADVNEIYRLIITRNQRLFDFMYHFIAPDLITVHGRKLLQEGVDSLIDNARLPKEKTFCLNNKALKSLTEILEGKQGRFRQSLLGKRVDYSGRSVIIVGPNLRLNQCGLPYEMVIELFQPFLINELLKTKIKAPSHNTKLAHVIIKKNKPFIWSLLESLTKKHSIILNRAPTLHRFGIQAFDPVLVLGQAIHLHPLVCTGFNADFDGDQMAVHLPLYETSQLETRVLMRPSYNVLSPSNGEVILKPTQDMVIGCYYLTLMVTKSPSMIQKWFGTEKKALSAFYQKKINIHTSILVRYNLQDFKIKIEKEKIELFDLQTKLLTTQKIIKILKIYKLGLENKKYFLITNIGIFIARSKEFNFYELTDLFLETTPGRLIFSTNFKNSINL